MINFIKKYLTRNNPNIEENLLTFKLDNSNFPSFNLTINDQSDNSAKKLALFIHYLNSGFLKQDMFDILLKKSHEDILIKDFLKNVMLYWMIYIKKYDNEPIISPTNFLTKG